MKKPIATSRGLLAFQRANPGAEPIRREDGQILIRGQASHIASGGGSPGVVVDQCRPVTEDVFCERLVERVRPLIVSENATTMELLSLYLPGVGAADIQVALGELIASGEASEFAQGEGNERQTFYIALDRRKSVA